MPSLTKHPLLRSIAALLLPLAAALPAHAVTVRVGPVALERALTRQMRSDPDGRYYLRGHRGSGCALYATNAQIHFNGSRIVLDMHLGGKLGRDFGGGCFGVSWDSDAEVSMLPAAQGAMLGFTDVHVDRMQSGNGVDRMLAPLLVSLVPSSFHINGTALVSKMLHNASDHAQLPITLDSLKIASMQVENNALVIDLDGGVTMP